MMEDPEAFEKEAAQLDKIFTDKRGEMLLKAFLALKDRNEISKLLKDLFSDRQITRCKNNLYAAYMLADGVPHKQIEKNYGLSSTTAAKIRKKIKDFESKGNGGYRTVLARLYPSKFGFWGKK